MAQPYDATVLHALLVEAGIPIHGCNSKGDIHFADGVTPEQQEVAAQIVAEYDARSAAREAARAKPVTPEEVDAATTVAQLRQIVKRLVEGV